MYVCPASGKLPSVNFSTNEILKKNTDVVITRQTRAARPAGLMRFCVCLFVCPSVKFCGVLGTS